MQPQSTDIQEQEWPEFMNEKTAARYIDTPPATLNAWRTRGQGPAFLRINGRWVRYRKADLDTWMGEQG